MRRREFIKSTLLSAGLTASAAALAKPQATIGTNTQPAATIRSREIPSSGEQLPSVGLGTWQTFDVGSDANKRIELTKVLRALVDGGGSVVDSSPMYGSSETVVGDLAKQAGLVDDLFMATKVWTSGTAAGVAQMQRSLARMQTARMDLLQVHNLLDAELHLETLREWRQQQRVRYLGVTHYHSGGYPEMLRLMKKYPLDFIQINYSLAHREAEQKILPLAAERGIAVLINRPFAGGDLFAAVRRKSLPTWAREFDCHSWGQFFLKFVLANRAVTCVIPGTSKVHHLQDNLQAGRGKLPTRKQQRLMLDYLS